MRKWNENIIYWETEVICDDSNLLIQWINDDNVCLLKKISRKLYCPNQWSEGEANVSMTKKSEEYSNQYQWLFYVSNEEKMWREMILLMCPNDIEMSDVCEKRNVAILQSTTWKRRQWY